MSAFDRYDYSLNRFLRLNAGRDMISKDDGCEKINQWLKAFRDYSDGMYIYLSQHLSLLRRAKVTSNIIFSCENKPKSSTPPARTAQRKMVYELLESTKVMTIVPGRKMTDDFFWDAVAKITPVSTVAENVGGELSQVERVVQTLFLNVRKDPVMSAAAVLAEEQDADIELADGEEGGERGELSEKERKRLERMKRYPVDRRALPAGGLARAALEKLDEFVPKRRQKLADEAETKRLQKLAVDLHIKRLDRFAGMEATKAEEVTAMGEPDWRRAFNAARAEYQRAHPTAVAAEMET